MDPYERPPQKVRDAYKAYKRLRADELVKDDSVLDFSRPGVGFNEVWAYEPARIKAVFQEFLLSQNASQSTECSRISDADFNLSVYELGAIPGLLIAPSLLPPLVQETLLSTLLHRHLSNTVHRTNIHLHHELRYPRSGLTSCNHASLFSLPPSSQASYQPKDPARHAPIQHDALLTRKLRWLTLGGQYDWTAKQYPSGLPPPMPADVFNLVQGLFPAIKPEAAIVNVYSPGDTLSVHRDVSESSPAGLVSLSLGCDGIFLVAASDSDARAVRLRSGDALFMTGPARFAWHGLPQVIARTCPSWLADWPAGSDASQDDKGLYEQWRGWMAGKRINLNVRQVQAEE